MTKRHGRKQERDDDGAASDRIKGKIREIEMQKNALGANWDKNFEDFLESLGLFETERNAFETQIENEIVTLAHKDLEVDPFDGQRLVYEYGLTKKKAAQVSSELKKMELAVKT